MEATNISIKQQSSVSINIETLQTIKQLCNVDAFGSRFKVQGLISMPRLYRKILRAMYAAERTTERHSAIANGVLCLLGMGLVLEVFFYA